MTKQRGSGRAIKIAFYLYKLFGYRLFYYLLYPITLYYFFFATNIKEALRDYYQHIGVKFTNRVYFRHLRVFAICMSDRFLTKQASAEYKFIVEDRELLLKNLKEGAILLFSHYGGWASLSNALNDDTIVINMVMQEAMIGGMREVEKSLGAKENIKTIDISSGAFSVAISIANALSNKEIVGIMADRVVDKRSKVGVKFFEKEAYFNKNPFDIAQKTNTKLLAIFVTNTDIQEYRVEYKEIKDCQEYVEFYEKQIIKHPDHWFNFYNFWSENEVNS